MNRSQLLQFLQDHKLGVVSTVHADGTPQAALVGLAVSDRLEIVFDTLMTTRKCQNLRQRADVAVVFVSDVCTVQVEGRADEPAGDELTRLRAAYLAQFPDGVERLAWPGITHVRVTPRWLRISDYRHGEEIVELTAAQLAALTD